MAAREMRMMAQGCKRPLGLVAFVGVWLSWTVFVPMVTEPVLQEVVLVPGVVVSSEVDPVLVVLVPGTEVVGDAPVVDEPRPEVFRAIPGSALLVAVVMDSIPVVTEVGLAGLVPVVLVPGKQVTQYAASVVETIKGEGGVLRTEELNLAHLWWCWWLEETYCGSKVIYWRSWSPEWRRVSQRRGGRTCPLVALMMVWAEH